MVVKNLNTIEQNNQQDTWIRFMAASALEHLGEKVAIDCYLKEDQGRRVFAGVYYLRLFLQQISDDYWRLFKCINKAKGGNKLINDYKKFLKEIVPDIPKKVDDFEVRSFEDIPKMGDYFAYQILNLIWSTHTNNGFNWFWDFFSKKTMLNDIISDFFSKKNQLDKLILEKNIELKPYQKDQNREDNTLGQTISAMILLYVIWQIAEKNLDEKTIIPYRDCRDITQSNIDQICCDLDKAVNQIKKSEKLDDVLIKGLSIIKDLQSEIFPVDKNLSVHYSETINWVSSYLSHYKPVKYFGDVFKFFLRQLAKDAIFFKFDFAQMQQLSEAVKSRVKNIESFLEYSFYSGLPIIIQKSNTPAAIYLLIKTPFESRTIELQLDEKSFKSEVGHFLSKYANISVYSLIISDPFTDVRDRIKNLSNGDDISEIKKTITSEKKFKELINQQDLFGNTLLIRAVEKDHLELVEFLVLNCNADISIANSQFESAIKIVQKKIIHSKKSSKAQVDILSFLLEHRQLQVNQAVLDIFKELDSGQSNLPSNNSKVRIFLAAISSLVPFENPPSLEFSEQNQSMEIKRLLANHLQMDLRSGNSTRIGRNLPYFLITLLSHRNDLAKKKQTGGIKFIDNEIKILCEMMHINMNAELIMTLEENKIDIKSIKALKTSLVKNIKKKIALLNSNEELVIPVLDRDNEHCYYLSIRADNKNNLIFRIDNLALLNKAEKNTHIQLLDQQYIYPAIIKIENRDNVLRNTQIDLIDLLLSRALWQKKSSLKQKSWVSLELYFDDQTAISVTLFLLNIVRIFDKSFSFMRKIVESPIYNFITRYPIFIALICFIHIILKIFPAQHPSSIYQGYEKFPKTDQKEFIPLPKQSVNSCVYENYVASIRQRIYYFFKTADPHTAEEKTNRFYREHIASHRHAAQLL